MPEGFSWVTTRQMQAKTLDLLADPAADLQQVQAQRVEPQRSDAHLPQLAPEGIEQPIGGGMQQRAELIGPEAVTLEPVGEAGVLEVVDPLFGRAALDVLGVERE